MFEFFNIDHPVVVLVKNTKSLINLFIVVHIVVDLKISHALFEVFEVDSSSSIRV